MSNLGRKVKLRECGNVERGTHFCLLASNLSACFLHVVFTPLLDLHNYKSLFEGDLKPRESMM